MLVAMVSFWDCKEAECMLHLTVEVRGLWIATALAAQMSYP